MKKVMLVLLAVAVVFSAVSCSSQPLTEPAAEIMGQGLLSSLEICTKIDNDLPVTGDVAKKETDLKSNKTVYTFKNCTPEVVETVQNLTGTVTITMSSAEGGTNTIVFDITKFSYASKSHSMYMTATFSAAAPETDNMTITRLVIDGTVYDPYATKDFEKVLRSAATI